MVLYAYCIIPFEGKNFSVNYGNKKTYLLSYKDIAAVVSNCDKIEHELNEDSVTEHEKIIRKVMTKRTIIPMAFGMTFKNEEILKAILEKSYATLKKNLAALHNKIEVGVKAILTKNIDKENLNSVKEDIESSLGVKSIEAVKGRLFSDKLLLNTSFLIEKNKIREFSTEVAKLEKKYPQFKFQYTGPWPPYSFVDIKIHAG